MSIMSTDWHLSAHEIRSRNVQRGRLETACPGWLDGDEVTHGLGWHSCCLGNMLGSVYEVFLRDFMSGMRVSDLGVVVKVEELKRCVVMPAFSGGAGCVLKLIDVGIKNWRTAENECGVGAEIALILCPIPILVKTKLNP